MNQYILLGILGIAIVIIAVLFSKEKIESRARDKYLEQSIEDYAKSIQHAQRESTNELRRSLIAGLEKTNSSVDDVKREADEKFQVMEQAIQNSAEEYRKKLGESSAELNRKIELLSSALEQMNKENAELRKKLEFFTEIGEDSKNINETEDVSERDALIQKALSELTSRKASTLTEVEPAPKETIPIPDSDVYTPKNGSTPPVGVLDDEQRTAFRIMNDTNENLFITGKAGTGKSFLLEMFIRGTNKDVIVLAPTGIAALNVNGATIHSTFGYSNLEEMEVEQISKSTIRLKGEKQEVLKNINTIIIDEISMVRADTFDKIDKILRVLNESAKPFGGKQMIVFGDLFQLPPIAKKQEEQFLTDHYGGIFFFNSNAYGNGRFGFVELTTNHRQKEDKEFFSILNRMREGDFTSADLQHLNTRFIGDKSKLRRILTLFPKKADAERLNKEELAKIEAREYVYKARVVFNAYQNKTANLEANFPITEELHLKRGALVMMVANDPNKKWVNGTIGIVHSLYEDAVKVTIDGTTYEVPRMTFTQREATYVKGHVEYKDVLKVEQFPIVLAYAITIHKSQGMTYKSIACDISQCFAPGQAYVALSRCSTMSGLYLIKEIYGNMIQTNKTVVDFYRSQSTEETVKRFS